jgi:hypothetical protein
MDSAHAVDFESLKIWVHLVGLAHTMPTVQLSLCTHFLHVVVFSCFLAFVVVCGFTLSRPNKLFSRNLNPPEVAMQRQEMSSCDFEE